MSPVADWTAEQSPPGAVDVRAPAKLNLCLRVLGRRVDGYHEIETIITSISLADHLRIHAVAGPEFRALSFTLEVTGEPALTAGVPVDDSNLVIKAAAALAERGQVHGFADVVLDKRIPSAAGLGGGSSDAAATLEALNVQWGVGLDSYALMDVAAEVGSDVPALLAPEGALARGRGEVVERLSVPTFRWALVTFPFGVSTGDAFAWWDEAGRPAGPDVSDVLDAARTGDPRALGPLLSNDIEQVVIARHPEIGDARERLLEAGALGTILCGSGPTMAGLLDRDAEPPLGTVPVTSGPRSKGAP